MTQLKILGGIFVVANLALCALRSQIAPVMVSVINCGNRTRPEIPEVPVETAEQALRWTGIINAVATVVAIIVLRAVGVSHALPEVLSK